ncbi:endolytic transglycosylase MltG [Cumulibacter manganitolerans]|uniref:endolytic transglycosylase MltG n=1 Tax=Cumulibacter manganitolerans TaxID=1884992 RepID=UPI00129617BA|nr:endolytic transglycosylase MltG [Cumulibacter manganitolerans]
MARHQQGTRDDGSEVDDLGALIRGNIDGEEHAYDRPKRHRRLAPALAALVAVAIGVAAVLFAKDLFAGFGDVPDYSGAGGDTVQVRVDEGDTISDIAVKLEDAGVVKSARAFTEAASANDKSKSVQPGLYSLKKQMKASLALEAMLDPNAVQTYKITFAEGLTVDQTIAKLAESTGKPKSDFEAALGDRANLGLPGWVPANANKLEGFLQPGTYTFDPEQTPLAMLQAMVAQFNAVAAETQLEQKAAAVGQSPYGVLIIASLIEREAKHDDERPKVARVIYNRLAKPMPLQIDAATAYGAGKPGDQLTKSDLEDKNNPYNLRVLPGLTPTPIASSSEASIAAALAPADGTWLYYVRNSEDGHHAFVTTDQEFLAAKQQCQQKGWC